MKALSHAPGFAKLTVAAALIAALGIGGCVGVTQQSSGTGSTSTASTSNAPSAPTAAAVLSVSSTSLSFGNVPVGTATSELLSLTNNGSANLHVAAVSVSGNGYSVSGGSNVTLMPAQSVTVSVNFDPTLAGYAGGALNVSSDATNSVVQVAISGTGITSQGQTHSVILSWTPSMSQVTGYFVYRGTVSGGPYTKLNATADPNPSYTDTGLTSGSYLYVVTSVNQNGVESVYSNEVAVVIP